MVCNHHNATIFEVTCTGRAATNAGRVITMVATLRTQFNTYVRIGSVYSFGYPVAAKADRYIILGLAGDYTVAAANTFLVSIAIAYLMLQPPFVDLQLKML